MAAKKEMKRVVLTVFLKVEKWAAQMAVKKGMKKVAYSVA